MIKLTLFMLLALGVIVGLVQPRRAVRFLALSLFVPVIALVALNVTRDTLSTLGPVQRLGLIVLGLVVVSFVLLRLVLPQGVWAGVLSHVIYDGIKLAFNAPLRFLRWLFRRRPR